jgi:hypothetical protein
MRILLDTDSNAASIFLVKTPVPGRDRVLRDDVIVTVDDGELTAIELLNVSQHGDLSNPAVAANVVQWVRGLMGERATA